MADRVRITVCWHQDCAEGHELAGALFNWFRGDPRDLTEAGRGIPVRYQCVPPPVDVPTKDSADAKAAGIDASPDFHILVALVDQNLVLDRGWRHYLKHCADGQQIRLIVPVALDDSAFQLPGAVSRLNFLRLDRVLDPADWSWERRTRTRRERLLSLLTQVVARELLPVAAELLEPSTPRPDRRAPPQIQVFISHAKADGAVQAEALRSTILGRGQLQAFYDESDLPIAYAYHDRLDQAAGSASESATQAMLAIYTDSYPTRPWCQRELRLARRPQPLGTNDAAAARCWRVKPLLVVADLAGAETRMLGEIGHAPLIAWHADRAGRIIDTLLREILLLRYSEVRAYQLLSARPADGRYALSCTPDIHVATEILRVSRRSGVLLTELLIPPPGLPKDSREVLEGVLSISGQPVRIRTFDEVETEHDD
jgi:hypothetical protein